MWLYAPDVGVYKALVLGHGMSANRILVIDDDRLVLDGLATALSAAGFVVSVAAGGHEALALARTVDPDIVVTDLRMPGMDGLAVLRRLRQELARQPRMVIHSAAPPETADSEVAGAVWVPKVAGHGALLQALQMMVDRGAHAE